MWIVMLNGALGNQMFQYIFALYLVQNGARVVVDDAAFFGEHVLYSTFEPARFFPGGILPRLSEHFSPDVWAAMIARKDHGTPLIEQLREGGLSVHYAHEQNASGPSYLGPVTLIPKNNTADILAFPREQTIYFWGYWLTDLYFKEIQDSFLSLFHFPPFPTKAQEQMARAICATDNAAAIHVRRTDMAQLGLSNPPEYFKRAIAVLEQRIDIDRFFLFSDDIPYCMEHAEELGLSDIRSRLTVVDGNRGAEAYVDMQLMSLCRFRIADRSSFSQLAGMLCRVPGNLTTMWEQSEVHGYSIPV